MKSQEIMFIFIYKVFNLSYNFCRVSTNNTSRLYYAFGYNASCCYYGIISNCSSIKNYAIITNNSL